MIGEDGIVRLECSRSSCSAVFLACQPNAMWTCPYCGGVLQTRDDTLHQVLPQSIVPFVISREHAESIATERLRRMRPFGRAKRLTVEHVQAVYVPHFLHDVFVYGEMSFHGEGKGGHGRNGMTHFQYKMRTRGHGEFDGVLATSSRIPLGITESVMPFDLNKALPQSKMSVEHSAPCLVEAPDRPAPVVASQAKTFACELFLHNAEQFVSDTAQEDLSSDLGLACVDHGIKIGGMTSDGGHEAVILEQELIALPMWVLRCTWKAKRFLFVVNGQTGACMGWPCSDVDVWPTDEATGEHAAPSKQHVAFRLLRVKRVDHYPLPRNRQLYPFKTTSIFRTDKQSSTPNWSSWRRIAMLDFATKTCENYNRFATLCELTTRRREMPTKAFVPFEETPIPIFDDVLGHSPSRGFAITDAGFWCVPEGIDENLVESYFTSWEEFAWSNAPSPIPRDKRTLMYSCGNAIAYCPNDGRLRDEFARAVDTLRHMARHIYPWEWVVSTRPETAAAIVMSNVAHTTCQQTAHLMAGLESKAKQKLYRLLRIGKTEEVLVIHDASRGQGDSCGFAITTRGFTCREPQTPFGARFVSWRELSEASKVVWDGKCVRADGVALVCYHGEHSTTDALRALCEELHLHARKAYGGRANLFLYNRKTR